MSQRTFFAAEEDDLDLRAEDNRCTPEKLESLIRQSIAFTGRFPTLAEIKHHFGGLLGAMIDSWELQRRGTWKELQSLARK